MSPKHKPLVWLHGDAIVIAEVFSKKARATPKPVIDVCKRRLKEYDGARK